MYLARLQPLDGGWSGETFVAGDGVGDVEGRVVVRIYARRPDRVEVDAALVHLVRGLLPVPRVLELRRARPDVDAPALLVSELLPGVRGDLLLPTLDEAGLRRVGEEAGRVAAVLGGMPMPRAGALVGADLAIEPWDLPDGLAAAAEQAVLPGWDAAQRRALVRVGEQAQALLDEVERRCLVHSDLNPKNLLVDPETLRVSGVVDWEYAHAGHPGTDLGNLLRFDRATAYADGVLGAYADRHDVRPEGARALARAADLWALLDLAGRVGENPVADRAARLLREVARTGDPGCPEPA